MLVTVVFSRAGCFGPTEYVVQHVREGSKQDVMAVMQELLELNEEMSPAEARRELSRQFHFVETELI